MGYGQYVNEYEHGVMLHNGSRRASNYPETPVSRRYTKDEVLSGIDPDTYQDARKTAHNEVTRASILTGARVVRLIATDILHVRRIGQGMFDVTVNTGGWNTPTTRSHIMGAIQRETGTITGVYSARYHDRHSVLCVNGDEHHFRDRCHFELHGGSVLHFQEIG